MWLVLVLVVVRRVHTWSRLGELIGSIGVVESLRWGLR